MPLLLWLAAAMALLTTLVHTFAGGREVARPLLASNALPPASKWLNYYCWHITTILLAFIAAGYALAAWDAGYRPIALLLTPLCAALSVLSAAVAMKGGIAPLKLPSTSLFAATAALGAAGLAL